MKLAPEVEMRKKVLMCRPDYFGVKSKINAHMRKSLEKSGGKDPVDLKNAIAQWLKLTSALALTGLELNFIAPQDGFPDMVFTANAGLVYGSQIILSNFRPEERRGEIKFFKQWFEDGGYEALTMPGGRFFEGHGDALCFGDQWIFGYGFRSDELGAKTAAEMIEKEPVLLKLVDEKYYHLDTCFCPMESGVILYYPQAFDLASRKIIENLGEAVAVSSYDARHFVCNAVPMGRKLVTAPTSKKLKGQLEKLGFEIIEINLSEFIKSGGAARCLTLFI